MNANDNAVSENTHYSSADPCRVNPLPEEQKSPEHKEPDITDRAASFPGRKKRLREPRGRPEPAWTVGPPL